MDELCSLILDDPSVRHLLSFKEENLHKVDYFLFPKILILYSQNVGETTMVFPLTHLLILR